MRDELMKYEVCLYVKNLRQVLVISPNGICSECELRPASECTAPGNVLCVEMKGCWVFPAGTRVEREW